MNGRKLLLVSALLAATTPAFAKEGVDQFRNGSDTFGAGVLPDRGWHFSNDLSFTDTFHYEWDPSEYLDAHEWRNTLEFTYVADAELWGAEVGMRFTAPLTHRSVESGGFGDEDFSSVGDVSIAPVLGWHRGKLHMLAGVEFYFPTGHVDAGNPTASIGANYYSIEPSFALTYLTDRFEASTKLAYNIKGKNIDTHYRSGDEFRADYLLGWMAGNWTFGFSGYWVEQLNSDTLDGVQLPRQQSDTFAIGPMVRYSDSARRTYSLEFHDARGADFNAADSQLSFKFTMPF